MINTKRMQVVRLFFKFLPLTRCHSIKASLLRWAGASVGKNLEIFSSVEILGAFDLSIGDDCFIGHNTLIMGAKGSSVVIGDRCTISSEVVMSTGTHEFSFEGDRVVKEGAFKNIKMEDGSGILMRCTIIPGVSIGKISLVAAGSVVVKDVRPFCVVAGNPAKIIKTLEK